MAKGKKKGCAGCLVVLALIGIGLYFAGSALLAPTVPGPKRYIRFATNTDFDQALSRLQKEGFIRSSLATSLYGRITKKAGPVKEGTYEFAPGMDADTLLAALQKPVRQMVRLPETNWARRSASLLEKAGVCTADEYMELFNQPSQFQDKVSFDLSKAETLEGYLYPDTYDLPPMLGAKGVIERQLANFEKKVLDGKTAPPNFRRTLIIASMIELEVMKDDERPIVAGVIENRITKGIPLQIDACLLYGIQKWRTLTFADYRNIPGPYNVYTHKGLPPGPICSPTNKSIRAAMKPAQHGYLYYVALPDGRHLFSATYPEHLQNIGRRKAALAAIEKAKNQ